MTEIYYLTFTLSFFYTLIGFYFCIFTKQELPMAGFLLLIGAVAADVLLRKLQKSPRVFRVIIASAVPLAVLFFDPALSQLIFLLFPYVFFIVSIATDRVKTTLREFRRQSSICIRLLPLMALGFLTPSVGSGALVLVIPYLVVLLYSMIWLLRMLRVNNATVKSQVLSTLGFLAVTLLCTVGRLPELIGKAAGWVYENVIVYALEAVGAVLGYVMYGFGKLLSLLFTRGDALQEQKVSEGDGKIYGYEELLEEAAEPSEFWPIFWKVLLGLAIIALLVLLLKFLLGKKKGDSDEKGYTESEGVTTEIYVKKPTMPRIRPFNAREAVRYDYARFMKEAARRGVIFTKGATSADMVRQSGNDFNEADLSELRSIYVEARYSIDGKITHSQSARSAELYRRLKSSRKAVSDETVDE